MSLGDMLLISGWMKKGVEKAVQVTNDTAEATAPARSQFYDMVGNTFFVPPFFLL